MCIRLNNAGKYACDRLTEDADFGKKKKKIIIFLDEAHFDRRVCKQAKLSHILHACIVKPMHLKRVTIWCGFWSRGLIKPFIFENEQGEAVTVIGDRYQAMFNEFLFTNNEKEAIGNNWFQQDGATCHTVEVILDVLRPVWRSHYQPQSCGLHRCTICRVQR